MALHLSYTFMSHYTYGCLMVVEMTFRNFFDEERELATGRRWIVFFSHRIKVWRSFCPGKDLGVLNIVRTFELN